MEKAGPGEGLGHKTQSPEGVKLLLTHPGTVVCVGAGACVVSSFSVRARLRKSGWVQGGVQSPQEEVVREGEGGRV